MSSTVPTIIQDFFQESRIPLTLSDPQVPDDPLILANKSFYDMTGFGPDEALGSNCRFMQGKGTLKASRNTIRGDFAANRNTKVLIRNYRKSGEPFDNFLYIFTIFDSDDRPVFRIGSQFEVPTLKRAKSFESHSQALESGLGRINESAEMIMNQTIDLGTIAGDTVKSLLMARLDNLKAN